MARDENGLTPLHDAALYNPIVAVITALLAAGADPKARDNVGHTPLHNAAKRNLDRVVLALLDAGADPAARTAEGRTAWDLARQNKWLKGTEGDLRLKRGRP